MIATAHRFMVPGRPMTWMRVRVGKHHGRFYTPKERVERMNAILAAWRELGVPAYEKGVPLVLTCRFHFARPKAHFREDKLREGMEDVLPTTQNYGDLDNLVKLVQDALNPSKGQRGAFHDDAQIVSWRDCAKVFLPSQIEIERTEITLGKHVRPGLRAV